LGSYCDLASEREIIENSEFVYFNVVITISLGLQR